MIVESVGIRGADEPAIWIFVVVTIGIVLTAATTGLTLIGCRAYKGGAMWGAPEGFTSFAKQLIRMTAIVLIVGATLALAWKGQLKESATTAILSGIAGYVLGGAEKSAKLAKGKNDPSGG